MSESKMKYHLVDNENDDEAQDQPSTKSPSRSTLTSRAILALLAISLLTNAGFLAEKLTTNPIIPEERSLYGTQLQSHSENTCQLTTQNYSAKLAKNIPKPFTHTTDYSSENLTLVQEQWDALSFDRGKVSFPLEIAAEMNLPSTQPFPWDPTRGIYLLNAHHNIHCLVRPHPHPHPPPTNPPPHRNPSKKP